MVGRLESRRWRVAAVAAAWGLCALVLVLWAWDRSAPYVQQDEHIYGVLARSFGHGDGYAYQDLAVTAYKTLWPAVAGLGWALFDGEDAWRAAQLINAVLWALTVVPAYALARRLADPWPAMGIAVAATLTPSAVWAGQLMTEALAYPLATTALLCAVRVLEAPSNGRAVLALGSAVAAGTSRTQLLVAVPLLLLAAGLDVARHGRDWRARLRAHRLLAAVAGAALLGALLLLVAGRLSSLVGTYAGTTEGLPLGDVAEYVVKYAGVMAAAMALLPFVVLGALVVQRTSWRDDRLAPVLCVAVAAVAVFWVNAAWASATLSPELRERYAFYPLPVVIALLPTIVDRVRPSVLAAAGLATTLYLVPVVPGLYGRNGEEFIQYEVEDVLRTFGRGDGGPFGGLNVWAAAVAVLVVLALAAHLAGRVRRVPGWLVVAAIIGPTAWLQLAVLSMRERDANAVSATFAAQFPEPPDFVDRRVPPGEDVAFLRTPGTRQLSRFHFELANERLVRTWRAPGTEEFNGLGADCPLERGPGGGLRPERGFAEAAKDPRRPCTGKALARYLVFDDAARTVEVRNGKLLFAEGPTRLYELPRGVAPRITYGPPPTL